MNYSIYGDKRYQRLCFITFFAIISYIVVTKVYLRQNRLHIPNKLSLPGICNLSIRHYVVKPFFNFVCDKNSLKSYTFWSNPDEHICDRLYSNNAGPNLFSRIHEDLRPFNKRKIQLIDIENISNSCLGCHHIQIIRNTLYNVRRDKVWNYETRSRSIKMLIKHVTDTFPDIPDVDLFFNVEDFVDLPNGLNDALFNVPIFALAKTKKIKKGLRSDRIVLMPCFTLWSWPEVSAGRWSKISESILNAAHKIEYEKRVPKLFWRGIDNWKRNWFINMTKKYPDTMDVAKMHWDGSKNGLALLASDSYKTLEQHCNYKYLLHMEGNSYSSRIKYLLLCGSTVVFNTAEYFEEYWYHLLENDKNIIFFEANNKETILNNTLYFLTHYENKAKEIGRQGQQLVQNYLNKHAVSCYWWKLLHEYAKLLEYKPSLHPNAVHIDDFILGNSP